MHKLTLEPVTNSTAEAAAWHREAALTHEAMVLLLDAAEIGLEGAAGWADDAVIEQAHAAVLRLKTGLVSG